MSKVKIEWKKCEFNLDNIWHNITEIDSINNLQLMVMVISSYYKFHNNNTTSALLENELRKRNLNVGLIAVEWEKDSYYKNIIDKGVGVIIKRKDFGNYHKQTKISRSDIDSKHISKYVIFISCRPREAVIEETLTHSSSMEENLDKLEEAGDLIGFKNEDDAFKDDKKIDQNEVNNQIQDGNMRIKLEKISFENLINEAKQLHPKADFAAHAFLNDGSILMALIDDNKIVCPIGLNIYHDKEGTQRVRYIPLQ